MKHLKLLIFGVSAVLIVYGCSGGGGGSKAPKISLSESSLDFAGVVLNNSVDQTIEIVNTGHKNLIIGQIVSNQPFSIVADTCSNATLAPFKKGSLSIRFSPTSQGSFDATLSIPSNDPHSKTVDISLSGIGYGLNTWINKVNSTSCPSISVDVTVTDPSSNILLNSLTADNFKLYQNGQILQSITATAIEYPSPVTLVLALDLSRSTGEDSHEIQAAAISFIKSLSSVDSAAICKFNGFIEFYPLSAPSFFIAADTPGITALSNYINTSFPIIDGTALYDAVFQSIDRAIQGTNKRAVIVLSDGYDEGSVKTLNGVITKAEQQGIKVFTIYYGDQNYGKPSIMQRLASETGGQFNIALTTTDIESILLQISNVLSNNYTLSYTSSACSGTTSLDVRVDWNGLYGQDSRTISFP